MIAYVDRTKFFALTAGFLLCTAIAAWYQQPVWLLVPFILLSCILLVNRPHYIFYALMISIPWSVEFNLTPQLGTDLPDEPLMWMTALMVLIILAGQIGRTGFHKIHPLIFLVGIQFIWVIITVITSTDFILSGKYLLAKSWYLLAFLGAPCLFFSDKKVLKRSVLFLFVSMMIFMLVAIIRHAYYGMAFENINDALEPFYRNHVNYSALLVFMIPVQVAVMRLTNSSTLKYILTCILVISIGALYFSYARGAWLALVSGLAAYWLIRKGILFFSFLVFLIITLAAIVYISKDDRYLKFSNDRNTIFHTDFREHLIATYRLKDMSNGERFYRWVAGIHMAGDHWETGFGPSTFYDHYKEYTVPSFRTYVSKNEEKSTVHNYFLLTLIEQGIVGLLLFIVLLAVLFVFIQRIYQHTNDKFWKVTMAAIASILVMECTVNFLSDMIETDKIGSVFWICIALVLIGDNETSIVKRET